MVARVLSAILVLLIHSRILRALHLEVIVNATRGIMVMLGLAVVLLVIGVNTRQTEKMIRTAMLVLVDSIKVTKGKVPAARFLVALKEKV
jgi:hypothetical protein